MADQNVIIVYEYTSDGAGEFAVDSMIETYTTQGWEPYMVSLYSNNQGYRIFFRRKL